VPWKFRGSVVIAAFVIARIPIVIGWIIISGIGFEIIECLLLSLRQLVIVSWKHQQ
jgi:hypothetical protein